ncbi:DUF3558 domain-containing protein [Streptomyces sp. NPDC006012]|uniref:DUF3558 domain-containing protein n=1 Tax=Streptomyces sp. NPDC006012 TaxID=3364739 RepID=UPI0036C25DB0
MQRKAYVTGTAALLVALLTGCTGGSADTGAADDANPGNAGTVPEAAQPGKYRTLPEPCAAVGRGALDSLLPGIKEIPDQDQRSKAYDGTATQTYDTDRKVGCRWKVESADATDHLYVDFERVVSYDNSVSDDSQAQKLFADVQTAADLPESGAPASGSSLAPMAGTGPVADASPSGTPSPSSSGTPSSSAPTPSAGESDGTAAADLRPRVLDGLGDEAFLDDQLGNSGSTAEQRTVTVVFRTSNVIVTIEYAEQPMTVGATPDSKEMQDRARNLAAHLAGSLSG